MKANVEEMMEASRLHSPITPNRSNIELSIDGGASYPQNVPLSNGSATFSGLSPGTYNVWARWGNDDCPIDLGSVTINSPNLPSVSIDPAGPFEDNGGIQPLSASPAGGTWGGNANPDGTFDPSVGVGDLSSELYLYRWK